MMEKRLFPRTDMAVTPLSYGAMELRMLEDVTKAETILKTVLDSGINFIDTSPDYGQSEELIGRYISDRRSEFYLATKCGCNPAGGPHIFTPEHIMGNLEESLRRLRTDYIDLWQLHCVVPADLPGKAKDIVVETMLKAKAAGKVRAIGVSFKNGKETDAFYPTENQEMYAVEMSSWDVFDSIQMVYGGLTRTSENKMKLMKAQGTGIIARGILKKYFSNYDTLAEKAGLRDFMADGETVQDLLLRFALSMSFIDTMIVGSKNPDHIVRNVRMAENGALPQDVLTEMIKRLDEVGVCPKA